jgi:16S rRNA C967 or C1407 C5-methylase (RsmB/RsmF family)
MQNTGGSLRKLFENCKTRRKMVYATCSILPSENQDQIAKFLATDIGKEFNFVKIKKFWLQNLVLMVSTWRS